MRRHLLIPALLGLFGGLLLSSDAEACHKKKCAAPVACVEAAPAPCPVPEPCPPKKGCGHKFKLFGHKKRCKAVEVCAAPCVTPVAYAPPYAAPQSYAPTYPAGQHLPTMQAPAKGL